MNDPLQNMYDLGVKHGRQQVEALRLNVDQICAFLENLTTDTGGLQKLRIALEEVTVKHEDESDRSEDLTDSLREQRGEFDRL